MSLDTVSEFYEDHHKTRGKVGTEYLVNAHRIQYFIDWLGTGKDILDIGCRDGELTQRYAQGNRVTGVDCDKRALSIASERAIDTHYADLNADLPFEAAQFDCVVAGEVLEHLFVPPRAVAEIARVLKPGGTFVGSVPNGYRFRNRRRFMMGKNFDAHPFSEHLHIFGYWHLRQLLEPLFEEVEIVPIEGTVLWPFEVGPRTPRRIGYLFGLSLVFRASGRRVAPK